MTSVFFTYPLELIRVRMAYSTRSTSNGQNVKPTFLHAAQEIYREVPRLPPSTLSQALSSSSEPLPPPAQRQPRPSLFTRFPILKFYRGFTVTLTGMVPYAGTSFLVWGFLRSRLLPPPSSSPPSPHPPSVSQILQNSPLPSPPPSDCSSAGRERLLTT